MQRAVQSNRRALLSAPVPFPPPERRLPAVGRSREVGVGSVHPGVVPAVPGGPHLSSAGRPPAGAGGSIPQVAGSSPVEGVPRPNRSSARGRTGASDVSVTAQMMSAPRARTRTSSHSREDRKPLLKPSARQPFALTNRYKGWLGKVEVRALAGDLPVERQIQGRRS